MPRPTNVVLFAWKILVTLIDCDGRDIMPLTSIKSPTFYASREACYEDLSNVRIQNYSEPDVAARFFVRKLNFRCLRSGEINLVDTDSEKYTSFISHPHACMLVVIKRTVIYIYIFIVL